MRQALLLVLVATTACPEPPEAARATRIVSTTLEPSVSLKGTSRFTVTADGPGVITAQFGPRSVTRLVTVEKPTAEFTASEFPEGKADMVFGVQSGWSDVTIPDVVVDSRPPELVRVDDLQLSKVEPLRLWVWDALAVASVEVTIGGFASRQEVAPQELSTALTQVDFDLSALAEGPHDLKVAVRDVTDNVLVRVIEGLVVDRTAPSASIVSPVDGAEVTGRVTLLLEAADGLSTPVIEIRAGGALLGIVSGTTPSLEFDTATLPQGALLIEATPHDAAGNVGEVARTTLKVQR